MMKIMELLIMNIVICQNGVKTDVYGTDINESISSHKK